jgi:hypothetical protein
MRLVLEFPSCFFPGGSSADVGASQIRTTNYENPKNRKTRACYHGRKSQGIVSKIRVETPFFGEVSKVRTGSKRSKPHMAATWGGYINRSAGFQRQFWRVRRSYSRWYDGGTEARSCLSSFISKKRRTASKYVKRKESCPCASRATACYRSPRNQRVITIVISHQVGGRR